MNSNMVKPEKFGHLHLVYHLTVPSKSVMTKVLNSARKILCKAMKFKVKSDKATFDRRYKLLLLFVTYKESKRMLGSCVERKL